MKEEVIGSVFRERERNNTGRERNNTGRRGGEGGGIEEGGKKKSDGKHRRTCSLTGIYNSLWDLLTDFGPDFGICWLTLVSACWLYIMVSTKELQGDLLSLFGNSWTVSRFLAFERTEKNSCCQQVHQTVTQNLGETNSEHSGECLPANLNVERFVYLWCTVPLAYVCNVE